MKHSFATNSEETTADFTVAHLAILKEFHAKAIAILRKADPKMSELNAALNMLIKIEKQQYNIAHRRPPYQRSRQPKQIEPETPSIIPFSPPLEPTTPKSEPQPTPAPSTDLENCHAKKFGIPSAACTSCVNGACALYPHLAPSASR